MHFTSALALLSVMAFAVQTGNACTDLCGDAPDDATEGILLDLSAHLNLIFKLERNDVSFCGSKIAEYADDLHMTIDPNTIYTLSKDGHLLKGDTCDAPLKCTDYPKGAACECDPATGPIVNPQSSKCLDARNLAVGQPVVLYTCAQALHSDWVLTKDHQIKSANNDFCLGKRAFPGQPYPQLTVENCDPGNAGLKWTIENGGAIKDKDGTCVDVSGGSVDDGATIILYPCHYRSNQLWTLPGDGSWTCQK